jgi:hypothetical protein
LLLKNIALEQFSDEQLLLFESQVDAEFAKLT